MEPARLTREAFDASVESLMRYGNKPAHPPIVSRRVYEFTDDLCVQFGLKTPEEPLTTHHVNTLAWELHAERRFHAYLASQGWRP